MRVFKSSASHRRKALENAPRERQAWPTTKFVITWEGWHHHQTLSLIATWFLTQETRRGKNQDSRADRSTSANHDRWSAGPFPWLPSSGPYLPHYEPAIETERGGKAVPLETTQSLASSTL